MSKVSLKRRIMIKVLNSKHLKILFPLLEKVNFTLFHFNDRMHMTHPGDEDPDKIYYVIRPRSVQEGLLSSYYFVMDRIYYAKEKGYIPYVDFDTDSCQYHIAEPVHGTTNAWEYYFKQPEDLNADELKKKKNVLLSGWSYYNDKSYYSLPKDFNDPNYNLTLEICKKYGQLNEYIKQMAQDKYTELFSNEDVLGVFIRGTDYVALKPKGHPVQPNVDEVISKANEWINKYKIKNVFLVTEDYEYIKEFKTKLNIPFKCSDDDFVKSYNKGDYISSSVSGNLYERGLNYLVRLIILSKCQYFISSITNGSLYSYLIKEHSFKAEYWFELGLYE